MMGRDFIAVASAAMRRTSRCSFAGTFELVTVRQRLFKVRVSRALSREKPGAPSRREGQQKYGITRNVRIAVDTAGEPDSDHSELICL
jgi:hypothetical protein